MTKERQVLQDKADAMYKKTYYLPNESHNDWLNRVSTTYQNDDAHGARIKSYIAKQWFHPSTPISSNAGTTKGLPISCFTSTLEDSKSSIFNSWSNSSFIGADGGGEGKCYSKVAEANCKITNGTTAGIIPFMRVENSLVESVSQGGNRRFSEVAWLDIIHPDILDFLEVRKATGDITRRTPLLSIGVVIPDTFMRAVISGADWNLISPRHNNVVASIPARELWEKIIIMRSQTGFPHIAFKDNIERAFPQEYKDENVEFFTSNLCCVAGDTQILTKTYGHIDIEKVAGKTLECWNGSQWSNTSVFQTSEGQGVLTVKLSNLTEIKATAYHKWLVFSGSRNDKIIEKTTEELQVGDRLIKFDLDVCNHGTKEYPLAYENGFNSGDGCSTKGAYRLDLYHNKRNLLPYFKGYTSVSPINSVKKISLYYPKGILNAKFEVPSNEYTIQARLKWLAGYLDADGCLVTDKTYKSETIQVSSIDLTFIQKVAYMLQELGMQTHLAKTHDAEYRQMPKNDGSGELKDYWCKPMYRLCISTSGVQTLLSLGYQGHRIQPKVAQPNRVARRYIKVTEIEDNNEIIPTFCGNEPINNTLMFNGVLSHNCEIVSRTDTKHSGVCCLASINLAHYDEFKHDFKQIVKDCADYLDNVLQSYIDLSEHKQGHEKFRNGAIDERSLGLGAMGFGTYLQKKGIPWDSPMAVGINNEIFSKFSEYCYEASIADSEDKICPMARRTGSNRRNIHVSAVAPTQSISSLVGTVSPSIEPVYSNAYVDKLKQGVFIYRNPELADILATKGLSDERLAEIWKQITVEDGSCQNIPELTEWEKDVYKTAHEINPMVIMNLQIARTQFIDQAISFNIFINANPSRQDLSDLHINAWNKGLKTFYYQRGKSNNKADTRSKERIVISECTSCQ